MRDTKKNKTKYRLQKKKAKSMTLEATVTMQQCGDQAWRRALASRAAAASRPAIRSLVGAEVNG